VLAISVGIAFGLSLYFYVLLGLFFGRPNELVAGPNFGRANVKGWRRGSEWRFVLGHSFLWPVTILKCNRQIVTVQTYGRTWRAHRCPFSRGKP
jgi:hypothetical protein